MGVDDPAIATAIDKLEHEDPAAAKRAGAALDWLTAGHGLALLTQARVQVFLWYELPTKWLSDIEHHQQVASALARAFDLLEVPRYAALCRSATTRHVFEAYERSTRAGREAFHRADAASGVRPPDLPEFEWGNVMGIMENRARNSTGAYLELAVAAGELVPGGRRWKEKHQALTRAHLTMARSELRGASFLELIRSERMQRWLDGRNSARRRALLEPLVDRVREPQEAPDDVEEAVAPVLWLLSNLVDGQALTETGNLNRAFVHEAANHFGWWDPSLPALPRNEEQLYGLWQTRQLVKRLNLIRRTGRRLVLTARGRELLANPDGLWRSVSRALMPMDPFRQAGGEVVLALLVANDTVDHETFLATATDVLTQEGWHDEQSGQPPDHRAVRFAMHETLSLLRTLNLVARGHAWRDPVCALTDHGRAAALEALHYQATGPTNGPYS